MTASISAYLNFLASEGPSASLATLYGTGGQAEGSNRCIAILQQQQQRFGQLEALLISAPGRTELGGNHTDHNHGRVLAAAVNLDCLAAISPNEGAWITVSSEGFSPEISIDSR